jgi:hypothetical protein
MSLYTVYFTSRHVVTKYDDKGVKTGEYTTNIPQTITMLPLSTAMQYKDCDGFRYEPYQFEGSGKRDVPAARRSSVKSTAKVATKSSTSSVNKAAATGDLSAAISGK